LYVGLSTSSFLLLFLHPISIFLFCSFTQSLFFFCSFIQFLFLFFLLFSIVFFSFLYSYFVLLLKSLFSNSVFFVLVLNHYVPLSI
jgi:hypothetical protein